MPLSYGTLSHLWASVVQESARSTPSRRCLSSGETAARRAVDTAIQVLGARGLEADSTLAHLYAEVRAALERILQASPHWDGRVWRLHVTEAGERTVELRCLMSAADSPTAWELRCEVREKMIEFVRHKAERANLARVFAVGCATKGRKGEELAEIGSMLARGAIALSDDDYATLDNQRKANLTILAQTELLPRHLVSVRKNLAWELIERLGHVLLSMKEDEEGRKILRSIDTTQFDVLPGGEEIMRRRLLDTFHSPDKR